MASKDNAALDSLDGHDTGFTFAPIGPLRAAALTDAWATVQRHDPVRAAWIANPDHAHASFRVNDGDRPLTELPRTSGKPIARFKVRKPEPPRQRRIACTDRDDHGARP
ncbi:hypothetical protein F6X54_32115 [Micromonospora aurantiaca]|uniref:Uncharacterized protein n=1 Tax=Micromonospora aurantiaca (nom. illeg.) TaxID=47850 RepID=A0ABQ6U6R6_9ACTN|nr:hypothetical protein [Micromonospora aurantiaca]KAB1100217.1 hypothetical protein F6X54_32115 [Micromonospora aurantiaca]